MTQEDKDLLIKDLCARLPFSVKLLVPSWDEREMEYVDRVDILYSVNGDGYIRTPSEDYDFDIEDVKPYLFPLSSMPEEATGEFYATLEWVKAKGYSTSVMTYDSFDCLNKHHIDYRGLIEKGLAIDATGLNIY